MKTKYIPDRQGELNRLYKETFKETPIKSEPKNLVKKETPLSDQELINKILASKQGNKFKDLWGGNKSGYNNDDSSADQALCNILAFWTRKDHQRMDSLFRQSGLYRDKWDERRGEQTYGDITIDKAIEGTNEIYSPPKLKNEAIEEEEKEPRKSISVQLVEMIVSDKEISLFHNEKKIGYFKQKSEILPLRSRSFKNYLRKRLWEKEHKTCGEDVLKSAIGVIEAKAIYDHLEFTLEVRATKQKGKYYYDLGGGRVVCFEKNSWELLAKTPILFRSFSHQKEQVSPKEPGDLTKILDFINFRREESDEKKLSSSQLLYLCYLVSCLVPDIPHPIIIITGDQGSGKSTLFRVTKPIIDPSHVLTISNPSDFKEFVQIADHHYALFLDNLTHLSDWTSDALCRFCTGEGFSKRELFSNDEDIFYVFRRCVGLNGINLVASRADLLDRSLIFNLERIADNKRHDEHYFYAEFERMLPTILCGLFDIFAKSVTYIDEIKLSEKPRMADFAKWGCAISRALGYTDKDFLDAYYGNISIQNEEALDASPVAKAIIAYMENEPQITKSSSDLHAILKQKAEELKINTSAKNWPQDGRWLWRRIREVRPNLIKAGIEANQDRDSKHKFITLKRIQNDGINGIDGISQENQINNCAINNAIRITDKNDGTSNGTDNILKNNDYANSADNANIFSTLRGDLMEGEI